MRQRPPRSTRERSAAASDVYKRQLLHLIDLKADTKNPEHPMWRSRFAYRTHRYVVDKLKDRDPLARAQAQTRLAHVMGEQLSLIHISEPTRPY
mgnify:CR=1 FL=1